MSQPIQEVFFTEPQIQSAIEQMARSIEVWLGENKTNVLNLVSVLEGARTLTVDLTGRLQKMAPGLRIKIFEIRVRGTDGQALLADRKIEGSLDWEALCLHSVLIVDDLVDSGKTLQKLKGQLLEKGIEEVRTAVLIRKFGIQALPGQSVHVDFLGLELNLDPQSLAQKGFRDCWLYGYGMDLDGRNRDLKRVEGVYLPLEKTTVFF
jgi:hypoxanthine phosphoribosyltransferase